ncbi:MAG TPA: hypothetical protein VFA78_03180 [Chloroflexota bacterium]|nr:hypothetical protein [Chloroflexota bacterium]
MRDHVSSRIILAVLLLFGLTAAAFAAPAAPVAAAGMSLSRHNVAAHDSVTVHGSGFNPGDTVIVAVTFSTKNGKQNVQSSATADSSGNIQTSFTVPAGTHQGTYSVTASDSHGHSVSTSLNVLPRAFLSPGGKEATIWVIPSHSFYVSGSGFKAGETVTLSATFSLYDGRTLTVTHNVQANGKGNFYEAWIGVPSGAKAGNVTLTATGQTSNSTAHARLHVFYQPSLKVASSSYRPGTTVKVTGSGFAPGATVQVWARVSRTNAGDVTISRLVTADGSGNVTAYLPLPSTTRVATYHVRAHGRLSGATTTTAFQVSVKPSISLTPSPVYPGQTFAVSGSNFGSGATVRVHATFPLQGGGNRWVGKTVRADGNGNYHVVLTVPGNAAAGTVTVVAASSNTSVHTPVQVQQKASPTNTPTPTPTPTPTSTPTSTSNGSHHSHHHKTALSFRWISVWYHTMRMGTSEHIIIQSTLHVRQGIWVHVWFPGGQHYAYFQNTDPNGQWGHWFLVPYGSMTAHNQMALVTFRLWHGKDNVKDFRKFKIIR